MRRTATNYRLTVAALVLLLALIVGLNGWGTFYTDIKPEVYLAPSRMISQYLSAWTATPYLGSPNFNVGLVPVLVVTAALRGIGLSPEWTYKVFHFALWLLTAWGTVRLTRRLVPRAGRWAALTAGVLVLANPYTIQAGATLAIALPMALLPWNLLCFVRAVHTTGNRVRDPRGWAWPAMFGLTFFAMSGMNVAVVPVFQLLALLPIIVVARLDWQISWRDILLTLGKCAIFVVGVSVYWLEPGFGALSTGNQIVGESETITGIAKVSSFPEVLRGMGLWPLYGHDSNGPWVPQDTVYVTSPVMIVLTMLWPASALLALRWLPRAMRRICALSIAIAAVVMVGAFPGADHTASPFGYAFQHFLSLPGMGAFRTTNKVGAVLALAFAIALGAAVAAVGPRLMRHDFFAPIAAMMAVLLVVAWTLPALTNRLYTSPMNIPSYWRQAAAAIDKGNPDSSVLFLPGQTQADYRWTVERPDDVANSLFTRNVIIPETTPNASAPGGNFLQSMDATLQNDVGPSTLVSTYARYLGAGTVLLRHDMQWEDDGGARPATTSAELAGDPGLFGVANYGQPGEYVVAPDENAAAYGEEILPPLQQYDVQGATTSLRAQPISNSIVVAGDGWSVPAMTAAGLLGSTPTFQYAQNLSASQLADSIGGDHTLVLSDTNARRLAITNRLTDNEGPLLAADQPLDGPTRTLGTDVADQTVLVRSGAQVTATSEGSAFFDLPYAVPANALDGDPSSAWLFGDFNRARGQVLTITEPAPVTIDTMQIAQAQVGSVKIDKVTVRAGGKAVTQTLPDSGYATFDLGGVAASKVTVTIDSTRGSGFNLVGISDIKMPGPLAQQAARTPLTFSRQYSELTPAQRAVFDRTPLDVLLTRDQGTSGSTTDDPEISLRRIVTLPDSRTFDTMAAVRVQGSLEAVYDQVAGYSSSVQASSSGFYFNNPSERASMAADGDPSTAWVPGGSVKGGWWQITGPRRAITSVAITQHAAPSDPSGDQTLYAGRVTITVDGKAVGTGTLARNGTTTIPIPTVDGRPVTGRTVRMTIDSTSGDLAGAPPAFPSIATGVTMHATTTTPISRAGAGDPRCITVATIDGSPVRMRPATQTLAGASSQGTAWVGCGTVKVSAGQHQIDQAPGFTLDSLNLIDVQTPTASTVAPSPSTTVIANGTTSKKLTVSSAAGFAVVISQSYDSRWQATANGKSLGTPQIIDGYSVGWIIPKGGNYTIDIHYGPQVQADVTLGVSIVAVLTAAALAVQPFVRRVRRRRGHDDDTEPYDDDDPDDLDPVAGRTNRRIRLPRVWKEIALVVCGAIFVGPAGAVAALVVVGTLRLRPVSAWRLQVAGAALLMAAIVVYLIALGPLRGQLSADGVARNMWPNYLAGAGLVVGLTGALRGDWRRHTDDGSDGSPDEQAPGGRSADA
ncbi:alpha-(1-_3)-arabinofuranosyltransferase domain-containing protein [Rudaeicoccus suwonensis]|uniref:Arabinofuranan 3-O-arabinosyltransferase n=1 Tax=Rudaeicoccus suwonensis TaxID=657409 RepID=A0A561EAJ2_9MICO|nr:alpha-(1->3)-arabinofuranosyltransferase family protein [Rudaeicoccus suwonensis]TWE12628.1 arabinofuranan 3-O-arabinosyltransferase [Rudaeicoccus suwonensis]